MTIFNKLAFITACVIIIFTTMAYGAVHQPVIAVYYILVAVMAIFWAFDGLIRGGVRLQRSWFLAPIIAGCLYGIVQTLPFGSYDVGSVAAVPRTISFDPYWTAAATVHLFSLLLFFFVFAALMTSAGRLRRVAALITIFGFLYAFYAILQFVLSPTKIYGIYESRFAMPFGSFVNRHNFAAYIEMTVAIPLSLVFSGAVSKDKRLLYITAIVLMVISLFLSGSRGGLVALVAELIIVLLFTTAREAKRKLAVRLALIVLLFVAMIGGAVFVGGDTSLTRLAETASESDVTTGRAHIWSVTVETIKHSLPLGSGFGAFPVAYAQYDSSSGIERVEQAHNDYLQLVADMGLIGVLIGIGFLFLLFRRGSKIGGIENNLRRALAVGAFVGSCGVLVHSLFDFVLHTTAITVLFVVLLTLLESSFNTYDDDVKDPEWPRRHKRKRGTVASINTKKPVASEA